MRIADGRGGAAQQHVAIELGRRNQAALDMDVCVDEARDGDQPPAVDLAPPCVRVVNPDDVPAIDGNIACAQLSADDVENPHVLDDQIRRAMAQCLPYPLGELLRCGWLQGSGHGRFRRDANGAVSAPVAVYHSAPLQAPLPFAAYS